MPSELFKKPRWVQHNNMKLNPLLFGFTTRIQNNVNFVKLSLPSYAGGYCLAAISSYHGVLTKSQHHCRKCGSLVCGACSSRSFKLANIGKRCRVCDRCFEELTGTALKKKRSAIGGEGDNQPGMILPEVILWRVFSFLDVKNLANAMLVCQYWNKIGQENSLWKDLYQRDWLLSDTDMLVMSNMNWMHAYSLKLQRERNWNAGNFTYQTLQGHLFAVTSVQMLSKTKLISASLDADVRLWDLRKGLCVCTLSGHTDSVWAVHSRNARAVTCSEDQTVRVWDLNSNHSVCTFRDSCAALTCVWLEESIVYSGSSTGELFVWDLLSGKCVTTLHADTGALNCLQGSGRLLTSGGNEGIVRLWDFRAGMGRCVHYILPYKSVPQPITCLYWDDRSMFVGRKNGELLNWQCSQKVRQQPLCWTTDQGYPLSIKADESKVISSGTDGTVKTWDRSDASEAGSCTQVFQPLAGKEEESSIPWSRCVSFDDSRLCVACGKDVHVYRFT